MRMSETNGKSMEFVRRIIHSGRCNGMENNEFISMEETNFLSVTEKVLRINKEHIKFENNIYDIEHLFIKENGEECEFHVLVEYNPDAEFEYFTNEQCICDGTYSFYISLMGQIVTKVFSAYTCYEKTKPKDIEGNLEKYDIKYTVGDFVIGTEFKTKEKPWLRSRFTVMLPIKCDFIRKCE